MAIGANQPYIVELVIRLVAINMIQFQRDQSPQPFNSAAA
jgi:hypothetical protein